MFECLRLRLTKLDSESLGFESFGFKFCGQVLAHFGAVVQGLWALGLSMMLFAQVEKAQLGLFRVLDEVSA